jgi:hypothetical protein
VKAANTALIFAEQHAMTYVSALFAHHASGVNAPPAATPGA